MVLQQLLKIKSEPHRNNDGVSSCKRNWSMRALNQRGREELILVRQPGVSITPFLPASHHVVLEPKLSL